MKHLFIPYPLALLAKEKGFNEPCLTIYNLQTQEPILNEEMNDWLNVTNKDSMYDCDNCTAPLYQQIIDWFREKHGILIFADTVYDFSCHTPRLYKKGRTDLSYSGVGYEFTDYYEALNKAIEEAFKLI